MKIYDCFTFYNELDLLDLRLAELYNHVDHFVIVEANTTFQNNPKPLFLKDNWDRYSQYHDKIIHVTVDDMPKSADTWLNERFQRDAVLRGLVNADPDDLAIISDVDEFIRPSTINHMRQSGRDIYGLRVPYFNFKFNYMLVNDPETYCVWSTASRVRYLASPEDLRRSRTTLQQMPLGYKDAGVEIVEHAGWHFTYLGDTEFIRNKIRSFAHNELNTDAVLDAIDVDRSIAQGRGFNPADPRQFVPVALDDYFPAALQQYSQYTISATESAKRYLPPDLFNRTLNQVVDQCDTDKEKAHRYVSNFYNQEFERFKNQNINLLEIGIWNGGSIEMWRQYFPYATIYGTDITAERLKPSVGDLPGVHIWIQDAYSADFAASLPDFDILIDDGPHTEASQIQFLELYLPKMRDGAVLVIEDILDSASVEKFKTLVPTVGYQVEIRDIRPVSKLPQSILFIVRKQ
jgi:hypothetical protein